MGERNERNSESLGEKGHTAHETGRGRAVERPSERKDAKKGGRSNVIEKRPNVSGKVLGLSFIVG